MRQSIAKPTSNVALAAVVSLASAASLGPSAFAQTEAGAEAFRRQEQREQIERSREQRLADVFLSQPRRDEPEDLVDEQPCFPIQRIVLSGAAAFPWAQLLADRYVGRCIGSGGINLILRRLTRELIDRGFVASRVAVPEQDLASGTLELVAVPGIIREIRFADDALGSWRTAFPARPGDVLNLRDLEQGLEQMKRLPSQEADIEILPGAQPGQSDIVIARKLSRRLRGALSLDDSGQPATGKYQGTVTLALDNELGLNDLAYVSHTQSLDREGGAKASRGTNGYYSMPYGYWTFALAASDFDFRQTIAGVEQTFVSRGQSQNIELHASRIVHRAQASKTALRARVIRRRSSSFLDDTELATQKRRLSAAELALNHRQYLGPMILDATLAHRRGVSWFGAEHLPQDATDATPNPRYRLWTLNVLASAPIKLGPLTARYQGELRAQVTRDPLFSLDFFAIGNRYTVRGFDGERTLAAERGWLIRNELGFPLPLAGHELYAGLDHGEVGGRFSQSLTRRRLTGTVLGLRGGWNGLIYEAFVGMPLFKPDGFKSDSPTAGFQVSWQF